VNRIQRWLRRLRDLWRRALEENSTPGKFALAVALGMVISAGPFWGMRAPLAIASAWATRLNRLTTVLASHVLFVPIVIPIWAGEVRLGAALLGRTPPSWQGDATQRIEQLKSAIGTWCLGAAIIAPALAIAAGLVAYPVAKRWQARRAKLAAKEAPSA
jgi:uncharacterized protein (DUF2062 family)